ncbi:ataxin-7-like protein 2 isoform X1 [Carettochelys insculpta]|uniref:ataxin-7-like protein 2 isoform X1 n=1 Tax=Carettochelys insculpta TaxID=44489 RepID=UPI003EBC1066
MAVRGRAAAAAAMAAVDRRLPSLDDFAGQSWSAWVERAGPPAEPGAEVEESRKNGSKKLDAMTLIKEDMSIFGHCPAHDEFYLVVCNHCSQVVKPQAFQKHCERRHGPLSKLYARAQASANTQKCHAVNGQSPACGSHGSSKASREKSQGSRSRAQHPPERPDKSQKDNLCLFMPVVNLEKISSLPKPDGHGLKVPPKAAAAASVPGQPAASSREPLGKLSLAASPKEPLVPTKAGVDSVVPSDGLGRKPEGTSASGDKEQGTAKGPPKSHRKMARKECDLNRQCGVVNPDTKKICTRLLTCKIHSVHQRREVQGRAKDFDLLVAELKASSRKGESPKEKSPLRKEALPDRLTQDAAAGTQPASGPLSASPCRAKQPHPHCALPRPTVSSESDPEEPSPTCGDRDPGLYPFPVPKGSSRVSSDESEDETAEESHGLDCHYVARPPRPQAFCTFGSRLVSPGCYVFNRRLDRFCSALSSMLERHLSSHMWKKIPPATDPQPHPAPSPAGLSSSSSSPAQTGSSSQVGSLPHSAPGRSSVSCTAPAARESRSHASLSYTVGSPHAAAACSQSDCTGGSQSITSPLPANTPSPSFSKLPSTKASKSSRAKELVSGAEPEALARKRKQPLGAATGPPYKRTCLLDPGKGKVGGCQVLPPPAKTKPSLGSPALNGAISPGSRVKRAGPLDCRAPGHPQVKASQLENRGSPLNGPKALQASCLAEEEARKRKNAATYGRPVKAKHPAANAVADSGCAVRRKKAVASLAFEEKRNALKSKAH